MKRCCILLLLIWGIILYAEAQQLSFNVYSPKDGLTDARVQKIFQDNSGVLYFLTREGFCSFDGQRFFNYTTYRNLPISIVNDILEVQQGKLLVSSFSGLYWLEKNILTRDTMQFKEISEPGALLSVNDKVIILSGSGTFLYAKGKTKLLTIQSLATKPQKLLLDYGIVFDNLLIGIQPATPLQQAALVIYDLDKEQLITSLQKALPIKLFNFRQNLFILENNQTKIIDTNSLRKGIFLFQPISFAKTQKENFFYFDKENNYWIKQPDGSICKQNNISGKTICYNKNNNLPQGISSLFQDAELNYWFIVQGKGVIKLVQSPVTQIKTSGIVQNITQQKDGTIYLKEENKIVKLQKGKREEFNLKYSEEDVIHVVKRNEQWLYVQRNGNLVNENAAIVYNFSKQYPNKQVGNHISFDLQNRMLLAGDVLSVFSDDSLTSSISLPYFTDNIVVDEQNNYWCFARNGVIKQYQLIENTITEQHSYYDNSFSTRFAALWNKDTFCIGTRSNGVVFVKVNKNIYQKLFTVNTSAGLSNNFISGLLKVDNNHLLTATVVGLDMMHFYPSDTAAEQLFSRIGLFSGVTKLVKQDDTTAIAISDEGTAYQVQLVSGISNPQKIVCIFNTITVNSLIIDPITQHSFSYNQNSFHFSVRAPSFIDEKNIRFIFKLVGNGKEYLQNSTKGDFDLPELPPGTYQLNVTVQIPGSGNISNKLSYSFIIEKPFWKKTSVRIVFILLILFILYTVFRFILKRKLDLQKIELEKQEAIAKERTRIATDMHDDLGAGISTIKYLSQSAPYISNEIQKENNKKISFQADQLVDKMNDIIWAMNETNDTLDNLLFYTKSWIANYAEQHGLKTNFVLPANIAHHVIRGEKRQQLFLIVKEAVHNIIKHAAAHTIYFSVTLNEKQLHMIIADDGLGFDTNKKKSGNGLANMQKRIQTINGSLEIIADNGTKITCSIPI